MKSTVADIRIELNKFFKKHWIVRMFMFKTKNRLLRMMHERMSDGSAIYHGMTPCPISEDHYRELAQRYRAKWFEAENKLEELKNPRNHHPD